MLLAIDIGNSTAVFGILKCGELKKKWSVETAKLSIKLPEWKEAVIISSVVPSKDKLIRKKYPQAKFVTASNIKGIEVRAERREVGADRVVNALAAKELYGTPAIVVDFGTATTFDVVSAKGEYLGGAIAPGIGLSASILHEATAKLPQINLRASKILIGKNTKDAINSGLLYGYVSLIEGMVNRIKLLVVSRPPARHGGPAACLPARQGRAGKPLVKVIATGGFAKLIAKYTKSIDMVDPDLTLKGLRLAYLNSIEYNNKHGRRT